MRPPTLDVIPLVSTPKPLTPNSWRLLTFLVLVQGMPPSICSQRVSPLYSPCENSSGDPFFQWKA